MRSGSRCSPEVCSQYRWALVCGNFDELDLLTTATSNNGSSAGRPYVTNPLTTLPQHRYEISLSINCGYDNGEGNGSA
jgi:hypothetical protein